MLTSCIVLLAEDDIYSSISTYFCDCRGHMSRENYTLYVLQADVFVIEQTHACICNWELNRVWRLSI